MILGLIGNKQVGKTTFADYLVKEYGFKTIAFADPIKEGAKIMFDLSEEQVNGDLKEVVDKRWGLTPRKILQTLGTDCCRNTFGKDIWIKRLQFELQKMKDINVIVSDIRFPNEAKAVKEMGGHLIKIIKSDLHKNKDSHISEQLIDKIKGDTEIRNDYSIEEYKNHIDILLSYIYSDK
jgi:adenylate kinase family enzyme